jgi:class 3 adenylate cyclase
VLIFDLGGFSRFFAQPDVQQYVPKYLNKIFKCMSIIIYGGPQWWMDDKKVTGPFLPPIHQKFLGDGALYIWSINNNADQKRVLYLANRLWNLKNNFIKIVNECSDEVPVVDLPDKIRFGLSAGSVYKLTYLKSRKAEYIGYPINLASRLQGYCRDLGFIASGRINLPEKMLSDNGYIKVIAKNLKGFPKEIVIVDESEYEILDEPTRDQLFESIGKN